MLLTIVAAMSRNRVIGKDNRLPWHLPADLRRFKALTLGKPILMGRRTYESIGRPLPGRRNVVLSTQKNLTIPGCEIAAGLDQALALVAPAEEAVVIGGARLFAEALPRCQRLHLTLIDADLDGDVFFPHLPAGRFAVTEETAFPPGEGGAFGYRFLTLVAVERPAEPAP